MSFDINVIPPTNRTAAAIQAHRDMYNKAMRDMWAVYNPTDKDFSVYDNKKVSPERWVIPNKDRDIGHGKGVQHVPGFIMKRYRDQMFVEIVNKLSQEDWDQKKMQYMEADRSRMEERFALKTSDPELKKKWFPILVKGIVYRAGDDLLDMELDKPEPTKGISENDRIMEELGMSDMDADLSSTKEKLLEQIQ